MELGPECSLYIPLSGYFVCNVWVRCPVQLSDGSAPPCRALFPSTNMICFVISVSHVSYLRVGLARRKLEIFEASVGKASPFTPFAHTRYGVQQVRVLDMVEDDAFHLTNVRTGLSSSKTHCLK